MAFVTLVDVGGYQVGVEVKGSGPLVVFVSAQGEPAHVWTPVWQRMSAAATLVAYDRSGVGASDAVREPEVPRPYGWFADELDATLRALSFDEPAVLVGHSFGCLIARVYAAAHPDREPSSALLPQPRQPRMRELVS